jgi:Zinc carboxypeptidase/Secretion system C-terminal sorting domain
MHTSLRVYTLVSMLVLCFLQAGAQQKTQNNNLAQNTKYLRVRVKETPENFKWLATLGLACDHGEHDDHGYVTEISNQEYLLAKDRVEMEVLVEDLEKYYVSHAQDTYIVEPGADWSTCAVPTPSAFNLGSMGGYLTYAELLAELDSMAAAYPNLITVKAPMSSTLTTHEGRPVYYLKISDNPQLEEANEPKVMYNALHHAREPNSMMSTIFYMQYLLENYATNPEVQNIVNNTQLYFVPCLNPDGYLYNQSTNPAGGGMWRKNRRNNGNGTYGVDLNRNYGYQWGLNTGSSSTTSSDTYRGPAAFSEPETKMIRDFCVQHKFVLAFNAHSSSNLMIHPWEYANVPNPANVVAIANDLVACNAFRVGNTISTLGYYASGTATDWLYGEVATKPAIIGFTPEIGIKAEGFYPPASRIIPLANSMIYANARLAEYAILLAQCNGFTANAGANQTICVGVSAPLAVSTAAGTAPFTYAWSNGNTQPAQTVTPTATTTYIVSVTDSKGCIAKDTVVITVNNCNGPCGTGAQVVHDTQGFETSWGVWVDGGTYCARVASYPATGTVSVKLNSNTTSSLMTTSNRNLTAFTSVEVSFSYIAQGFALAADDFWLQVSTNGGTTYTTVRAYVFGTDFANNARKNVTVNIPGPYTSTMRFRFRCDAAGTGKAVYIDDVTLKGCTPAPSPLANISPIISARTSITGLMVSPNPVIQFAHLSYEAIDVEETTFELYDALGSLILRTNQTTVPGINEHTLNMSNLSNGVYFLTDQRGNQARILKL